MITEEQIQRNLNDTSEPTQALLEMGFMLRRDVAHQERVRLNDIVESHNEDIASLRKQLDEKNREITDLKNAVETLEEQNNELQVTLKLRNEEIKNLKARLSRLENEKKELEDELRSVQVKVGRLEKEIRDLNNAKTAQDEKNIEMQEHFDKVQGKMETRSQAIKNEMQAIKETPHKAEMSMPVGFPKGGRQTSHQAMSLQPFQLPGDRELQALLFIGEMCQQVQNKMYKVVFPNLYAPRKRYKVKHIHRDLEKFPQPPPEKEESLQKWQELTGKFKWNEAHEEAMKDLQGKRNIDAHPSTLTEEGLTRAAELLDTKGNLKGWSSFKRVLELITIWKRLQQMDSTV
ncbi:hypothetical protein P5673_006244 [Acropora cervicornis]|uniref:Uncharacterized protein n=1 Tax=Acropora cervicornis TaxID=6130 RepID=A0AAD9VCF3_ACRCE|nr:hypothetical protein P5673_006244 [Acropora cervicornis]